MSSVIYFNISSDDDTKIDLEKTFIGKFNTKDHIRSK